MLGASSGFGGYGVLGGRLPLPGEQLMQTALRDFGDACDGVGEPGLRIDVVKASSHDQRDDDSSALGAAIGTCEQPSFSPESSRRVILPISGRKQRFTIGGTRSTGVRCAAITLRCGLELRLSSSKDSLALRSSWRHGCLTRPFVQECRLAPLTFRWKR